MQTSERSFRRGDQFSWDTVRRNIPSTVMHAYRIVRIIRRSRDEDDVLLSPRVLGTEDLLGVHQLHRPRYNGFVDMASFRPACLWKVSRRHLTSRSFEEEDVEKGDRGGRRATGCRCRVHILPLPASPSHDRLPACLSQQLSAVTHLHSHHSPDSKLLGCRRFQTIVARRGRLPVGQAFAERVGPPLTGFP